MAKLLDLARMTVASAPGTGASVALGAAVASYLTLDQAGAVDGQRYRYAIRDGNQREVSSGVYTAATKTLTRTVLKSTNNDAAINATATAIVSGVVSAADVPAFTYADTAPPNPKPGDYWFDSLNARLGIWTDDGTSQQWVSPNIAGPPGPAGAPGTPGAAGPAGPNGLIGRVKITYYTASATHTRDAKAFQVFMETWGAGGGGGGVGGSSGWSLEAAGGGGGGYACKLVDAATFGASQPVTVGAGGNGGPGGAANSGGTGGASSVGTLCAANGGGGATGASNAAASNSGGGGLGTIGDTTQQGCAGQHGRYDNTVGDYAYTTQGGTAGMSRGGVGQAGTSGGDLAGQSGAANSGAGGGGGTAYNTGNAGGTGGAGGSGFVKITEYLTP